MGEKKWVVEINEEMEQMEDKRGKERERWEKRSIYKVPGWVRDLNKKAYKPQAVSFGPYHHGEENLKEMEGHKHRALLHFLKRSKKDVATFVNALEKVEQQLRDCYDEQQLAPWQDSDTFLHLMILDGCFMVEVLRFATGTDMAIGTSDDYDNNDPIFSTHGNLNIMPYIRRDMLMLENQLPMLLLHHLVAVETGNSDDEIKEFLNRRILKFCGGTYLPEIGTCLHVLDVYRKGLLLRDVRGSRKSHGRSPHAAVPGSSSGAIVIVRSATELNEAGIRLKKSKSESLKDITFRRGVLKLPLINVDDTTESKFLNLMAYERLHVGAGNEITSYIFFMDNLIDSAKDVSLLHSKGIIQNAIGSDKAVAKLFNSLSKDVTLDPEGSLDKVHKKVNYYCDKHINQWRANLFHTYFRNPWAIISFVAALFLMALTIAQTVYTIYPYYHSTN